MVQSCSLKPWNALKSSSWPIDCWFDVSLPARHWSRRSIADFVQEQKLSKTERFVLINPFCRDTTPSKNHASLTVRMTREWSLRSAETRDALTGRTNTVQDRAICSEKYFSGWDYALKNHAYQTVRMTRVWNVWSPEIAIGQLNERQSSLVWLSTILICILQTSAAPGGCWKIDFFANIHAHDSKGWNLCPFESVFEKSCGQSQSISGQSYSFSNVS